MKRRSARGRLSRLVAAWTAGLLLVYSLFSLLLFHYEALSEIDRGLREVARSIASDRQEDAGEHPLESTLEFRLEDYFAFLVSEDGRILAMSKNLQGREIPTRIDWQRHTRRPFFAPVSWKRGRRGRYYIEPFTSAGKANAVVVVRPMESYDQWLRDLSGQLFLAFLVWLAAAIFFARLFARRAMNPIEQIAGSLSRLGPTDLSSRVGTEGMDEEFARLSGEIDLLLDRLEEAFRSRDRFLQFAGHELKTPVTALLAEAQSSLLRLGKGEEVPSSSLRQIEWIARSLARLVDDLFFLARARTGRWPVEAEDTDLSTIVSETSGALSPLASSRRVAVSSSGPAEIPLRADPHLIARAIRNLLENALRFSEQDSRVQVLARATDGFAEVEIRDEGPGMPEGDTDRLLEPFARGSGASLTYPEGAGLGLAVVRWVADAHGGSVEFSANVPHGTIARLRLPRTADSPPL